jgi:hypothetical protein
MYEFFWTKEDSLKDSLLKVLDALQSESAADECRDMLQIIEVDDHPVTDEDY